MHTHGVQACSQLMVSIGITQNNKNMEKKPFMFTQTVRLGK